MDAGGFALPLCLSTPTLAHSHSQDTQTHMCACVCSFVCSFTCLLGCFEQSKSSGVRRSSRMWRSTLTRFVGNNNMAAALALSLSLSLSLRSTFLPCGLPRRHCRAVCLTALTQTNARTGPRCVPRPAVFPYGCFTRRAEDHVQGRHPQGMRVCVCVFVCRGRCSTWVWVRALLIAPNPIGVCLQDTWEKFPIKNKASILLMVRV